MRRDAPSYVVHLDTPEGGGILIRCVRRVLPVQSHAAVETIRKVKESRVRPPPTAVFDRPEAGPDDAPSIEASV